MSDALPIAAVLPNLRAALSEAGRAVLIAPPGAGKTTGVPLALLPDIAGRILMLEPRRLAARAAAARLAEAMGQSPGGDVGFRIRGESVPGRRIEVVTEGILTRMLQSDPALPGIGCVIFDEFHERSLDADLGLALTLEARAALRPDLRLLVMSATLDAAPVAALLDDAPVIEAEGRAFPVETRWLDRPLPAGARLETEAARLIARAFAETGGAGGADRGGPAKETAPRPADTESGGAGTKPGADPATTPAGKTGDATGRETGSASGAAAAAQGGRAPGSGTGAGSQTPGAAMPPDALAGTLLAFLPGEGEIRRVAALLADLPAEILPLYGAMPFARQKAVLAPPPAGAARRIVLATAIAETSLTIPGVRVVVDTGRARRARFDPASGMARLVTERASRAEAEQRRGRAGRVAPGVCYRMWARAEEGAMPAFAPPEIVSADLTGLALELAVWGSDPADLAFLTPPPAAALTEARMLLADLGALDAGGRITAHGRRLAALPLHPRLGHMLAVAGPQAADLAALLSARDPLRTAGTDLAARLRGLAAPEGAAIRAEAARLRRLAGAGQPRGRGAGGEAVQPGHQDSAGGAGQTAARPAAPPAWMPGGGAVRRPGAPESPARPGTANPATAPLSPGAMASLAYPDRIGLRRPGEAPRFILSGGRGAALREGDPMAGEPLIVALDLDGTGPEPRIRLAAALTEAELRALHTARITREAVCEWSARDGRILSVQRERLGALILAETPWPDPDPSRRAAAALDGLSALGLPWTPAAARLRARIALTGAATDDATLLGDPDWLLPFLARARTAADLRALDLTEALTSRLGWDGQQRLDRLAPAHFTTPLGRRVPIDYATDPPSIEVRLPEMYGLATHPTVAGRPLRIALLSPAGRPVQVTTDLPGFWDSSYPEVRKEMRGRYPRHPWPEDPRTADPTTRVKPRGG